MEGDITPVVPDRIWVCQRPIWFHGVRLWTRTTVVRTENGELLVHSPSPPTDEHRAAIEALGEVRWLVVPNKFHYLGCVPAADAWPDATVVAPESVGSKAPALRIDADIRADWAPDELGVLPLDGVPFLDESVLFHRPTRTMIGTDIVMSCSASDHWTWRLAGRAMGLWGRVRPPPDVKWNTKANEATAASIDAMCALDVRRLLVTHAGPIEDRPTDLLRDAWAFVR